MINLIKLFKIKGKKGLQIKSAFFAMIIVGVVITAIGVIINDWNIAYNSGINYDLDSYNAMTNATSTAEDYERAISPTTPDTSQTFEGNILFASYGVLGNILEPFRVIFGNGGLISQVTTRFGLPDYIRIALVTMIILGFIFALIAIVFRLFRLPGGSV